MWQPDEPEPKAAPKAASSSWLPSIGGITSLFKGKDEMKLDQGGAWAYDEEHKCYLPTDPVEKAAELAKAKAKVAPPPPMAAGFGPPQ